MTGQQTKTPRIEWKDNQWTVTLPLDDGRVVDASWKPAMTYVVRIREASSDNEWSFGFETPLATFTFIDLKPDTEYEVQVRGRNAAGEGPPAFFTIRTDPAGGAGNVIPFPLH